jgi:hypothetical protein
LPAPPYSLVGSWQFRRQLAEQQLARTALVAAYLWHHARICKGTFHEYGTRTQWRSEKKCVFYQEKETQRMLRAVEYRVKDI